MINLNEVYDKIMIEIMDMDTSKQTEFEIMAALYTLMAKLERGNIETNLNKAIKKRRTKNAKKTEDNINKNRTDPVR